jgi:hypothetical protein
MYRQLENHFVNALKSWTESYMLYDRRLWASINALTILP